MTRPRSHQINDPSTRYTKIDLGSLVTPGSTSTTLTAVDFSYFKSNLVTDSLDGVEVPCPAVLTASSADPLSLLSAGAQFNIRVDSAPPVTIVLTAAEFVVLNFLTVATVNRIAYLINTILSAVNPSWANVASRTEEGYLRLTSPTTGTDSSIEILGLAAVLNGLGFGAVTSRTAIGKDVSRGLVSVEPDAKGGYVFPAYSNGVKATANSYDLYSSFNTKAQSVPVGSAVYGRVTSTSSSVTIDWVTKAAGSGKLVSGQGPNFSDFTSLVAGDKLIVTFIDLMGPYLSFINVTFAGGYTDIPAVVDEINNAWAASYGSLYGYVYSTTEQPYSVPASSLEFVLNGIAVTVNFSPSDRTNTDIVTAINAAIGLSAPGQGTAFTDGDSFVIASSLPAGGGYSSSVNILSYNNPEVLRSLGLSAGVYRGHKIARQVGAEIEIVPPSPTSLVLIDSTSALAKLGLSGYPVSPNYVPETISEIPCSFPVFPFIDVDFPKTPSIYCLVPELMEAGDIPDENETLNRIAEYSNNNNYVLPLNSTFDFNFDNLKFSGQARLDSSGKLEPYVLPYIITSAKLGSFTFSPYLSNPASLINYGDAITNNLGILEAFKYGSASVRFNVIEDTNKPNYLITVNAEPSNLTTFNIDVPTQASAILRLSEESFSVTLRDATGTDPYTPANDMVLQSASMAGMDRELAFTRNAVLNFKDQPARISDPNIRGVTTSDYYAFSAATNGSQGIRVHDLIKEGTTIFQHLNARAEITCGDGANTFGDFNGPIALSQAVTYTNADGRTKVIRLKAGTYQAANKLTINNDVSIIGDSAGQAIISAPTTAGDDTLQLNGDVYIRDVTIYANSGRKSLIINTGKYVVEKSTLTDIQINTGYGSVRNCQITGQTKAIDLRYGTAPNGAIVFESCYINGATTNSQIFTITQNGASSLFKEIIFRDCNYNLNAPTTVGSGGGYTFPHNSYNTGILEIIPTNDGRAVAGLEIDSITFENCIVSATTAGVNNIILAVCSAPTSTKATDLAPGNPWGDINNLTLRGCKFTAKLKNLPELGYFTVGSGVNNLTIDNCDFNVITGGAGGYGGLPDFMSYTWSAATTNDRSGVVLATNYCTINNTRFNDLPINVSNSFPGYLTCDLLTVTGAQLVSNGLVFIGSSTATGSLTNARDSIWRVESNLNVSDPIYSTATKTVINHAQFEGTSRGSEWTSNTILKLNNANNAYVGNSTISGFTTSIAAASRSNISGIRVSGCYTVSIENTTIRDVSYGIYCSGGNVNHVTINGNKIYAGAYKGALFEASGILFNASNNQDSLDINNNLVDVAASNNITYGGIHVQTITKDSGVKITNNYVYDDNAAKYAFVFRPYNPGIARYPRGYMHGNGGYQTGTLNNLPKFLIQRWDSANYQSIDPLDIEEGTLVGAETESSYDIPISHISYSNTGDGTFQTVDAETGLGVLPKNKPLTIVYSIRYAFSFDLGSYPYPYTDPAGTYKIEYYNGSTWAELLDTKEMGLFTATESNQSGNLTFTCRVSGTLADSMEKIRLSLKSQPSSLVYTHRQGFISTQRMCWTNGNIMIHNSSILST